MPSPNNPAGRLVQVTKILQGGNPNSSVGEVWCTALGVENGDWVRFHIRMGAMGQLVDTTVAAVRNIEGADQALFLRWEAPIRSLVGHSNYSERFQAVVHFLVPEVVQVIEFCDHLLSEKAPELTVTEGDLASLKTEAWELLEEVRQAALPFELRRYLTDTLEALLSAVEDYGLAGVAPLRRAFTQAVGSAVILDDETAPAAWTTQR